MVALAAIWDAIESARQRRYWLEIGISPIFTIADHWDVLIMSAPSPRVCGGSHRRPPPLPTSRGELLCLKVGEGWQNRSRAKQNR